MAALDMQVEELLDLFLGVGAPWPPENRQARAEAPAFVEDTSSRAYTVEAVPPHARLEAHSPYTARYCCTSLHVLDALTCNLAGSWCPNLQFLRASHPTDLLCLTACYCALQEQVCIKVAS